MERKNGNGKYHYKGSKNNNCNNKKKKQGRQDYNDIECYHCKK